MPYKRSYRKPSRSKQVGSALDTASRALAVAYAVKKLVNVEYKFHDVNVTLTPNSTGAVSILTAIGQGDSTQQRDGNSIKATSLSCRFRINGGASAPTTHLRMILFSDSQQQGVLPTVANVLDGADTDAHMNILDFPGRFRVLRSWDISLSNSGMNTAFREAYIKLDNHIKYEGAGTTVAEARKGNLYLMSSSSLSSELPTLVIDTRLRYIDN